MTALARVLGISLLALVAILACTVSAVKNETMRMKKIDLEGDANRRCFSNALNPGGTCYGIDLNGFSKAATCTLLRGNAGNGTVERNLHHSQRCSTSHWRILYDTEARGSQHEIV